MTSMKLHRFIGQFELDKKYVRISDPAVSKQLRKVLRINVGDKIVLCDGEGKEAEVEITKLAKNFLEGKILSRNDESGTEPLVNVTLYCAILKKDNFEFVTQKATEIGVNRIVPVVSERTIKLHINSERLLKIAKEACEQSGRKNIPEISDSISLDRAFEESKECDISIVFDINGESISSIENELESAKSIAIFIGPEGGWHEDEIKNAKFHKFPVINISPFTLRAETAAIIATHLVLSHVI